MLVPLSRRRLFLGALAALLALDAVAQSTRSSRIGRDSRSSQSGRTAGGGSFPTWEREVESEERSPLAEGDPGRFVPAWVLDLGGEATGVAALRHDLFVAALADGRVIMVSSSGENLAEHLVGGRIALPPVSAGGLGLIAAGERVVAVDDRGVAWRSAAGGRIIRGPAVQGSVAYVAREGGSLERLSLIDGRREWIVSAGADIGAGPAAGASLVLVGLGGDLVGLDARSGAESWRIPVGEIVDAVGVVHGAALASGLGRSGRSSDITPVLMGQPLGPDGLVPRGRPWRLRVGGRCMAAPVPVDTHVAVACADGYVRAVERRSGLGGWKTDLPTASSVAPLLSGARIDFVIPRSRHAVALGAENGAVLGWVTLPDEDETFVGTSATAAALLVTPTSFGRLLAWTWEWSEVSDEEEDEDERYRRPGQDANPYAGRGGIPILR